MTRGPETPEELFAKQLIELKLQGFYHAFNLMKHDWDELGTTDKLLASIVLSRFNPGDVEEMRIALGQIDNPGRHWGGRWRG